MLIGVPIYKTRFETATGSLGYAHLAPSTWQFVWTEGACSNQVGPIYATRAELLADLNRYAAESWGFTL